MEKAKKTIGHLKISNDRMEILGIATLLVVMHHSKDYNWIGYPYIIFKLCLLGSIGVDVFLLLSGIGLYYSMKKCGNTLTFYKHRLLRIFPSYLLMAGIQKRLLVCFVYNSYVFAVSAYI